jgi:proteasome accessory factor B
MAENTAGQASTSRKSERLLNLLIMLLVQRHYVSKERIRTILYPDSRPDAFEKMFERDKEELRSLGVPIEVGSIDPLFDDEPGYRISPDDFALPDVRLTADEAAVVGLATRVWEHARLAEATTDAVRKLRAAGVEVDVSALDLVEPRLSADEPAFDVFWDATQARQEVEFDYQRPAVPGDGGPLTRHLQPWGVVRHAGRWYVLGFDTDRGEERVFRLSRVVGDARRVGSPGSYDIPDGLDLRETTRRLAPPVSVVEATLLLRKGAGATLRRGAASIEADVTGPDTDSPWDRVVLRRDRLEEELLALGPNVVVESPPELRDEIVSRLRATVGAGR